jgi:hypothetical protein
VNDTSLRHLYEMCMAVLLYQTSFAYADFHTRWDRLTWQIVSQSEQVPGSLNAMSEIHLAPAFDLPYFWAYASPLILNFLLLGGSLSC